MAAYYMIGQPAAKGRVWKRRTISSLRELSQKSIDGLLNAGIIRELITPPVEVFPRLKKYVTLLSESGIKTLGDFAVATDVQLARIDDSEMLKKQVLFLIHPNNDIIYENCCNNDTIPLPYITE